MKCPNCEVDASVENTFGSLTGYTTRRGLCPKCGAVLTEVSYVVYVNPKRGFGASAISKRIMEGKLRLEMKEATPEEVASRQNNGQHSR